MARLPDAFPAGAPGNAAARHKAGTLARPGIDLRGPLPAALALLGCALYAVTLAPVSDHGWQFYMAERVLDGADLYVDVGAADMHPPLFTWLAMAIAAFGRFVTIDGLTLYPVFVLLVVAGSLECSRRLLHSCGWILAVLVLAFMPMAGPFYGQGEHLALVMSFPYFAGAVAAIRGHSASRGSAIAAGIAAGIGLAFKPHFALVWVGVELLVAKRRGVRSVLRPESIAIASVFVLYVLAALALTPELFRSLPWLMQLYPRAFAVAFHTIVLDERVLLVGLGLFSAWRLRKHADDGPLARVLAVAMLAMYIALLLQGKGWGYHWYPVTALAVILCGLALRPFVARFRVAPLALSVLAIGWMQVQSVRTARLLVVDPVMLPQMMDVVETHARGQAIVAFSHLIQTGFPLVNLMDVRWASPYAHLWMVPAMYSEAWAQREPVRYRDVGEWQAFEQQMFDRIWEEIVRDDPAIIFMHVPLANGFDMRAYFETDARFRARFARSPVIDTIGRYIVLGRPVS